MMLTSKLSRPVSVFCKHSCVVSRRMSSNVPKRLTGKVAVVTASTDGIGLAIARRLGQEGAKVMISSRKPDNVQRALKELEAEKLDVSACECHVGKPDDRTKLLEQTVKDFGKLDILVSNAAVNPVFGDMLDSNDGHWTKLLDVNVKAAFLLCKESIPIIEQSGGGSIIIVSSIAAYQPFPLIAPYSVCKTALLGLTKALVPSCADKNIRVNGIAPGIIKTAFSKALWSSEEVEKASAAQVPMGRLGRPEECAGTVAFLASDDASYITGETIAVGGGMMSHL